MTGFWFFAYIVMTMFGIYFYALKPDENMSDEISRSIVSMIASLLVASMITLNYYAGVYNYVTGFDGYWTPFCFWLGLISIGMVFAVFTKGLYGIIASTISIFLLYQIGAFNPLFQ